MSDPSRIHSPSLQYLCDELVCLPLCTHCDGKHPQLSKPAGSHSLKTPGATASKNTAYSLGELTVRSSMLINKSACVYLVCHVHHHANPSTAATQLSTSHAQSTTSCCGSSTTLLKAAPLQEHHNGGDAGSCSDSCQHEYQIHYQLRQLQPHNPPPRPLAPTLSTSAAGSQKEGQFGSGRKSARNHTVSSKRGLGQWCERHQQPVQTTQTTARLCEAFRRVTPCYLSTVSRTHPHSWTQHRSVCLRGSQREYKVLSW